MLRLIAAVSLVALSVSQPWANETKRPLLDGKAQTTEKYIIVAEECKKIGESCAKTKTCCPGVLCNANDKCE